MRDDRLRELLQDCLKGMRVLRAIGMSRSYKTVGKAEVPSWGKPIMETCDLIIADAEEYLLQTGKVIQSAALVEPVPAPSEGASSLRTILRCTCEAGLGGKHATTCLLARAVEDRLWEIIAECQAQVNRLSPIPSQVSERERGRAEAYASIGAKLTALRTPAAQAAQEPPAK